MLFHFCTIKSFECLARKWKSQRRDVSVANSAAGFWTSWTRREPVAPAEAQWHLGCPMAGRCPGSPAGDPKLIDKVLELDSQWVPRQNTEAPGGWLQPTNSVSGEAEVPVGWKTQGGEQGAKSDHWKEESLQRARQVSCTQHLIYTKLMMIRIDKGTVNSHFTIKFCMSGTMTWSTWAIDVTWFHPFCAQVKICWRKRLRWRPDDRTNDP